MNVVATFAVFRVSWLGGMVKPLRDTDETLAIEYRTSFEAGQLTMIELTPPVIERAASLGAGTGLKTPGALQAPCAFELGGEVCFVTNDEGFRKAPIFGSSSWHAPRGLDVAVRTGRRPPSFPGKFNLKHMLEVT